MHRKFLTTMIIKSEEELVSGPPGPLHSTKVFKGESIRRGVFVSMR